MAKAGAVQLRQFGSTGLQVSPLGLGTVKLGRNKGLKHPPFELPDDRTAEQLLGLASDLGINLVDTAPAYGTSEERLGKLLLGQRNRWVICTKVGEEFDSRTAMSRYDFSAEHVRFSIERSLGRLRTDFLDLVLVHSNGTDEGHAFAEALDALGDLKAQGKLRAFGISSKTMAGGLLAVERTDCAMITVNPFDAEGKTVSAAARQAGKGILVKKPLAAGALAASAAPPVGETLGLIFSQPGVTSVVIGTIDPQHVRNNASACERAISALASGPAL